MNIKSIGFLNVLFIFSYCGVGYFLSNVSFQSQVVPVWLPAGIALAGCYLTQNRLLPAVFISSFIFNFSVGPKISLDVILSVVSMQNAIIAAGAALQAYIGATLLMKWIGDPINQPINHRTFYFVMVVGILVNLVSANVGVLSLTNLNEFFTWDAYKLNVVYWWLGDSAGVLIATPLILSFVHCMGENNKQKSAKTLVVVASSSLFLSIVLMTWLFVDKSNQSTDARISSSVKSVENAVYRQISHNLSQLQSLANSVQTQPPLSNQTFVELSRTLLQQDGSIKALSWNPVIAQTHLPVAELEMEKIYGKREGPLGYINGEALNDTDPLVYVKYITPLNANNKALGFNVFSNRSRRDTLQSVFSTYQPAATNILQLVQSDITTPAYLIFYPVFNLPTGKNFEQARHITGFVTGVFLVEQIIDTALTDEQKAMFQFQLFEQGNTTPFITSDLNFYQTGQQLGKTIVVPFKVLDKQWELKLTLNDAYVVLLKNESFLVLFLLQFAIVVIFISLILLMNNRQVALDSQVEDKTKSLKRAVSEANLANAAKSRFLANMSHEIRTPMNSVVGFTRLAKQTNKVEEMQDYIEKIEVSSDIMMHIVDDILDIAKIESNKLQLSHETFDLKDVLANVSLIFKSQAEHKGLIWTLSDGLPSKINYIGDKTRVQQILMNLCSNALKFTEQGRITLSAKVTEVNDGEAQIQIQVADTGIGMSESQLNELFSPFTQADNTTSRKYGGTGLGLSIAKQLSNLMRGDVTAHSEFGQGSVFNFRCPLPVTDANEAEQPCPQSNDLYLGDLRVLVAEDNKINQLLIVKILKQFDITPVVVENGLLAVEASIKQSFDLVLMDCQMPVMDGYQATIQILAESPNLPVFALTADVDAKSKEKAERCGFKAHLSKPIDVDKLRYWLSYVCQKKGVS